MINPLMLLHHQNIAAFCQTTNAAGTVWDFPYTGAVQTITLGKGTYKLEVWGAEGGSYNTSYASGGKGGYSYGTITLTDKSTTLYVYSGGQGSAYTTSTYTSQGGGGFNGGGGAGYCGGGGGGASDIRIGTDSLYARVIVAGGGGGAYSYASTYKAAGGYGGGTSGASGSYYSSSYSAWVGKGGSQTAGGAAGTGSSANYNGKAGTFGIGGNTGYKYNSTSYYSSGAGGGGWYGGGGAGNYSSSSRTPACGGGGGSGYIYTSSTASNYPSGCLLTSTNYLTDAQTIAGNTSFTSPTGTSETGHTGNGYCRITCIKGVGIPKPEFVEYIESTGTQWIDTGFKPNNNTRTVMDFQIMSLSKYPTPCGTWDSTKVNAYIFVMSNMTTPIIYYGSQEAQTTYDMSRRYIADFNKNILYLDGIQLLSVSAETFQSLYNLYLFRYNNGGTSANAGDVIRLYSCKIYDNDILVRDFVPARQNGIFGLWDKVEKKFYGSASSTQFVGSDKNLPTGYTRLNYIESSGTQYIDTEFTPNQDSAIKMIASPQSITDTNPGGFFFGASYPGYTEGPEAYIWNSGYCVVSNLLGSYYKGTTTVSIGDILDIQFEKNNCNIYRNNLNILTHTSTYTSYTSPTTLQLCRIPRQNVYWGIVRIYCCQIYDNGRLIRDYVPVRNSSGVYGLYDLVNKTFTSSATSTQFTGG